MELKLVCNIDIQQRITRLLIVPYGIETGIELRVISIHETFNRTLWN